MPLPMVVTALLFAAPIEPSPTPFERAEVARIQAHFDGAIESLAARDLSALTADQRRNRAGLVEVLRAYRDRGVFPRNYDFPGEAVPYFIDRKTGIRCAVAHLAEHTGAHELVRRVADADNNVWVAELAGDAAFEGWLAANGLTLEEAARIQVPYVGDDPLPSPAPVRERVSAGVSTVALGAALTTTAINTYFSSGRPGRVGVAFGAATGALAMGSGALLIHQHGDKTIGAASIVAGGAALFIAGRAFRRARSAAQAASVPAPSTPVALLDRATIAPIIPFTRTQGLGASISLTF